jgi:membrane associated rhomboid family serine protease
VAESAVDKSSWFLALPITETPAQLRRSPGTSSIIVLSLAVVALGGIWPSVTRALECTSKGLREGELWRLITYVFPHEGGWQHVVVNMAVLALFGWQYERRVGSRRLVAVYLGCGAVGMALLSAWNPIDAERGLRSGASLAVFGIVAALTVWHVTDGGWRAPAIPWATGTCLALLVAGGVLAIGGHAGVIEPGLHGFVFGFLNHGLGMVAGLALGVVAVTTVRRSVRCATAASTALVALAALGVGLARWA